MKAEAPSPKFDGGPKPLRELVSDWLNGNVNREAKLPKSAEIKIPLQFFHAKTNIGISYCELKSLERLDSHI